MKHLFYLLLLILPEVNIAQNNSSQEGIQWTVGLTWQQVKQEAKKENKYIFVDCFATWCGPCKAMDKSVYPNDTVSHLMNQEFICVRVQMDRTQLDDEEVKKWYSDAKCIEQHYTVTAFPTFLFFSPDGQPLHKGVGYKDPDDFISMVHDAFNPQKQYYAVLKNFQPGKLDTAEERGLAHSFRISDKELAGEIAADYLNRIPKDELKQPENLQLMTEFTDNSEVQSKVMSYLKSLPEAKLGDPNIRLLIQAFNKIPAIETLVLNYLKGLDNEKLEENANLELLKTFHDNSKAKEIADRYINSLPKKEIFTWKNISLLADFTKSSKDRGFGIFYSNAPKVDTVVKRRKENSNVYIVVNFAETIIDNIIAREELGSYWDEAVKTEHDMDWKKLTHMIAKKYDRQTAERIILIEKVGLYNWFAHKYNRYWHEYIECNLEQIKKYGTDTTSGFMDALLLNNFAWNAVFLHSNDKEQLNATIKIMKGVIRRNPDNETEMDTYANLLYKAGQKKEALEWEGKALQIAKQKNNEHSTKEYQNTIDQMKKDVPIWTKD